MGDQSSWPFLSQIVIFTKVGHGQNCCFFWGRSREARVMLLVFQKIPVSQSILVRNGSTREILVSHHASWQSLNNVSAGKHSQTAVFRFRVRPTINETQTLHQAHFFLWIRCATFDCARSQTALRSKCFVCVSRITEFMNSPDQAQSAWFVCYFNMARDVLINPRIQCHTCWFDSAQ